MWVKWALTRGGKQWLVFDDDDDAGYWSPGTGTGEGEALPLTEDDERKLALLMMLDGHGPDLEGVGRRSFVRNRFVLYREED